MGREGSNKPTYEVLAYITLNATRVLGGKQLTLLAKDEEEQKEMCVDIAKSLKADITQLKCGDYIVIRN